MDNIIAALGQSNRVCQVGLWGLAAWRLEKVLATMQVPFPELTDLRLSSPDEPPPVIPDSFLGGSAPRLRYLTLDNIPFPGLPNLFLSATHLVYLYLHDIPHSGYISPEAMAAPLSVLSSLRSLFLEFRSPHSHPDWESRSPPSLKRSILPTLDYFRFEGVTGYLEEFVTHIDTPQLNDLNIAFFDQIDFDCPRLAKFINRTPTLRAGDEAYVEFGYLSTSVELLARDAGSSTLKVAISWRESDRQLSSVAQVCNSSLYPLSTVEDLYIERQFRQRVYKVEAIKNTQWLQLLLPFTAVEKLYLSQEFALGIAATLQELVGSRITEVLPSLQNIFVEWPRVEPSGHQVFQESIGQFVAARQLSGHPVFISGWDKGCDLVSM